MSIDQILDHSKSIKYESPSPSVGVTEIVYPLNVAGFSHLRQEDVASLVFGRAELQLNYVADFRSRVTREGPFSSRNGYFEQRYEYDHNVHAPSYLTMRYDPEKSTLTLTTKGQTFGATHLLAKEITHWEGRETVAENLQKLPV